MFSAFELSPSHSLVFLELATAVATSRILQKEHLAGEMSICIWPLVLSEMQESISTHPLPWQTSLLPHSPISTAFLPAMGWGISQLYNPAGN